MSTIVVHCRREPYDVYIGRRMPRFGLAQSLYANPYRIGVDGDRDEVVEKYRQWVLTGQDTLARWIRAHVHELQSKRLGCWCAPERCHGEVLAEMAERSGE